MPGSVSVPTTKYGVGLLRLWELAFCHQRLAYIVITDR